MGHDVSGMGIEQPDPHVWVAFATVLAFGTLPYVELIAANAAEIDLGRLAVWWAVVNAASVSIVWLAHRWAKAHRTAVLVSVLLYLGFRTPDVAALQDMVGLTRRSYALGWLILTLVVIIAAIPLSRRREIQIFVALVSVGLLAGSGLPLATLRTETSLAASSGSAVITQRPTTTPNIWVLVPDGYSRADVVKDRAGLDLTPWLDELRARGFEIAEEARANYPATWSSLPSMLEMDYILDGDDRVGNRRPLFDRLQGNNATIRTLRRWGYGYLHSGGVAWEGSRCSGYEDTCVGRSGVTETEWALLSSTPLSWLLQDKMFRGVANLSDPVSVAEAVLDTEPEVPYFVFAHLLTPHPPFVRDAECGVREDVPDYVQGHPDAYRDMVECLNQQLLDAIDRILEADEDAVIVIQSDHGHDWGLDWADPHNAAWRGPAGRDRWPVLAALRLPDRCPPVPDDLSPVNTMRLTLACLSGDEAELVPYRSWITTYHPDVVPNTSPSAHP